MYVNKSWNTTSMLKMSYNCNAGNNIITKMFHRMFNMLTLIISMRTKISLWIQSTLVGYLSISRIFKTMEWEPLSYWWVESLYFYNKHVLYFPYCILEYMILPFKDWLLGGFSCLSWNSNITVKDLLII